MPDNLQRSNKRNSYHIPTSIGLGHLSFEATLLAPGEVSLQVPIPHTLTPSENNDVTIGAGVSNLLVMNVDG